MRNISNSLSVGFFLAIKTIRYANIWTTIGIVFVMVLTFLNLVVVSGILVGLIAGSTVAYRQQWTGDLFVENLNKERSIKKTDEIINTLNNLSEVQTYSGRIITGVKVEANWWLKRNEDDANTASGQIAGIDPIKEDETTHLSKYLVQGEWLRPDDAEGIVLGSAFLQEYSVVADLVTLLTDVKPGTRVRITVNREGGKAQLGGEVTGGLKTNDTSVTKEFIVRGVVKSKVGFVSQRAYILDSELRKMLGRTDKDLNEISIRVIPDEAVYDVKSVLFANKFNEGAKINTAEEGSPEFLVQLKQVFGLLGSAIGFISLVVAAVVIFIIIFINALTRRRQIGILKGIGVSEFAIEFSYIVQSTFYAFMGSGIGTLLVFGFIKPYFDANPINFPFSDGILVADFNTTSIRIAILVIITLFAGYIPARMIVKRNTLNAILGR